MTELEHLQVPLSGMHLIEASAGTGKTYAIALLYLRLLVERDLAPGQILVVTYTEAATKELRGRIRNRIREALEVINEGETADPLLKALCNNSNGLWEDRSRVRDILNRALVSFDTASIFTIHGFCLRALQEHAFESGSRYDTGLVTNQAGLLQEVVDDFWRRSFFGKNGQLLDLVLKNRCSVDSLKSFVAGMVGNPHLNIIPVFHSDQIAGLDADCAAAFTKVQQTWCDKRQEIMTLISLDKGLSRSEKAYRADLLPLLFEQMDRFAAGNTPYALPDGFSKFCKTGIIKGTTPTGTAPEHLFFELCEELQQKTQGRMRAFLGQLIAYCNEQLPLRKQQKNIRFFDDLLNDLFHSLCSDSGTYCGTRLRTTYQAALIDEFQDTDPVQYHIFKKIYAGTAAPLFLIGDPKQAIYSFRGADIFAYMQAAADVPEDRRFTLTRNWRSTPDLLAAFNTLFTEEKKPFVYEQIAYHPLQAGKDADATLTDSSGTTAPLQICQMPSEGLNVTAATRLVPRLVATELSRLLHEGVVGQALIGDQPVRPGDCAVIVRSHRQAAAIRDALSELRIPSVLRSAMTIFETDQARELCLLLRALQQPGNEPSVRAALVTDLLGWTGSDIAELLEDEQAWEQRLTAFRDYHQLWRDKGFMVMMRQLLAKESIRGRLLRYRDGNRRMTNLLHCLEVIHAKTHERGIGLDGLVSWFSEQVSSVEASEEHEIRLETDEQAVRIVTVHVSKGLEYPVVFCPFLWGGLIEQNGPITFHDGYKMIKDYGSPDFEEHHRTARKEQLAESLRLLYVAVTRARFRCYLYTGKVTSSSDKSSPETSPISYLLHASQATRTAGKDLVAALATEYQGLSDRELHQQLEELAAGSAAVTVIPQPAADQLPAAQPWQQAEDTNVTFSSRLFQGTIRHDWRVSSFTSFAAHDSWTAELPDRDETGSAADSIVRRQMDDGSGGMTIFNFPKGAQAGIFMHAIFEELDFSACSRQSIETIAGRCLAQYGFDAAWLPCVTAMVHNVVNTPLPVGGSNFTLSDLKKGSWLAELEFFFPLYFITADTLRRTLQQHIGSCQAVNLEAVLAALQFRPVRGMVRGFMDMVCEHEGRYYLLDWKSNHLGSCIESYHQQAIRLEMERNLYPLQYLLYTVALNRYLALRIRNYSYTDHFGGVFYLFVRGMDAQQPEQYGIFRDLPPAGLIEDLTSCLLACEGEQP